MYDLKNNQSGVILIMAVMLMAILLSIALGFGVFIMSDLRQAIEIDNSVTAYYAADSGLERTLFLFRRGGKQEIGDFSGGATALSFNDRSGDVDGKLGDDWTIEESTDYEPVFFRQRLLNGQSVRTYFLGRNSLDNLSKSIKIEWLKGGGISSPKLQVIFTQLTPTFDDGVLVYYTDTNKVEISDTADLGNPICFDFKDKDPSGASLLNPSDYMIELRVLGTPGDYIDNISITGHDEKKSLAGCNSIPYNDSYNAEAITNITIKSVGTYLNVRQEVYAHIPPLTPLSGVLGFVLFSQEDITKGY